MRFAVLALMILPSLFGQDTPTLCSVSIRVVDYSGRSVPYKVLSFENRNKQDYSSAFVGLRGRVPCDLQEYVLTVGRADFDSIYGKIGRRVLAWREETWVTLVTNPNLIFEIDGRAGSVNHSVPDGHVLNGRLTPVPIGKLWIQLRSIANASDVIEAEVGADGAFRVYRGIFEGLYVLQVVSEAGQVLHIGVIEVTTFAPKDIFVVKMSTPPPVTVVR